MLFQLSAEGKYMRIKMQGGVIWIAYNQSQNIWDRL